jgi:phospholipid transport system substrate-binding protein
MNRSLPAFAPIIALALVGFPVAASAQAADPAIPTIEALDGALIGAMKAGKAAGAEGRYRKLVPAVERAFDLPLMTRFAVGTAWAGYSAADQAGLVKAFTRLSAANLAHNFDSYDGEQFKVDPQVQTRGVDKLLKTQIIPASGAPTDLNYRMRQSGGTWKVIDVYFGAISQLTAQRSDFAATAQKGADVLIASMNAKSDSLLK